MISMLSFDVYMKKQLIEALIDESGRENGNGKGKAVKENDKKDRPKEESKTRERTTGKEK